jgi:hypothetical protein
LQPVIFGGSLRERYKLIEIHLHWGAFDFEGSEHTICNRHYPVEVDILRLLLLYIKLGSSCASKRRD